MNAHHPLISIYSKLWEEYGPQGWWPLHHLAEKYHPGSYDFPKERNHIYEIITGAILTQNTAWTQVEKALFNLREISKDFTPEYVLALSDIQLKDAIKPAGYYNQKADYLRNVTQFFIGLDGKIPTRHNVLQIKGVGPETADSIMLYAFQQPEFVVDAYTRRILSHLGLIKGGESYHTIKKYIESHIPRDLIMYQEYHALIVVHGKKYYPPKPELWREPVLL